MEEGCLPSFVRGNRGLAVADSDESGQSQPDRSASNWLVLHGGQWAVSGVLGGQKGELPTVKLMVLDARGGMHFLGPLRLSKAIYVLPKSRPACDVMGG